MQLHGKHSFLACMWGVEGCKCVVFSPTCSKYSFSRSHTTIRQTTGHFLCGMWQSCLGLLVLCALSENIPQLDFNEQLASNAWPHSLPDSFPPRLRSFVCYSLWFATHVCCHCCRFIFLDRAD